MRAVVQRVSSASVEVEGTVRARCEGPGLLVLAGLEAADTDEDLKWIAEKIANLRIFPDDAGKMNRSVIDAGGAVVLVPNFTLAGEAARGRRPSFDNAMKPELSEPAFARFARMLGGLGPRVETGVFRAHMNVGLVNDGPITIWLDSRARGKAGGVEA
jgi:D-tyrosyl-tRNA(Tyr) deacylase